MVSRATATSVRVGRAREAVMAQITGPLNGIQRWFESRDWDEGAMLMVFGAIIGVAAGIGVVVFYHLIDLAYFVFITWLGSKLGVVQHTFYRPLLTAGGLWAAWALVRRFRTPPGQNVSDVQLAVAKRGGRVPWRPVAIRTIASAITLGSGGSAGSEGPTAVLGATVGSEMGQAFRFQPRRVKILVGCGAAAGISAAFNAPFAGAFFALEEVLGAFSIGAFSPVVIASVVGALTVRPFLGSHPAFHIPPYGQVRPLAIVLLYPILG
ncbi:MAG TPA: chloride channel protein, partial [Gemmatimonadaceae bacterium]|nr:chloride channel protein [Gemmatimonadaceae bacterium]